MKINNTLTWRIYSSKLFYFIIILLINNNLTGQTFLNGSFENNTGNLGSDYYNLSNIQFNNLIDDCYSFSSNNSNLDLMSDNFYSSSGAQHGKWYIGVTNSDSLSLELSEYLIAGKEYKITFYDNSHEGIGSTNVIIGVSEFKDKFGTIIYQGGQTEFNTWRLRYFTFKAPFDAKFITVTINNSNWAMIDNFCISQDDYCVDLPNFEMPNVFTPNNDGINDYYKPITFKGMKSGSLVILNRWGQVVFETENLQVGWNGLVNGKPASDGVYFWKVNYITIFDDKISKHGFLTLVR